nr:MAG TPA: hypothetical protein [Caudoviricetes sp.]
MTVHACVPFFFTHFLPRPGGHEGRKDTMI